MAEIPSISSSAGVRPVAPKVSSRSSGSSQPAPEQGDTVEISPRARLASLISQVPEVRSDLVARVRAEIDAGTYETPEKLDIAVERLLDDLGV